MSRIGNQLRTVLLLGALTALLVAVGGSMAPGYMPVMLALAVAMNVVLLLVVLAVDCKPLRERAQHMDVTLEGVYTHEAALVAELESKLGGRVAYYETNEIDLIHGHMVIDVRLQPGEGVIEPPVPKSPKHAEDGAAPAPSSGPAQR